MKSHLTHLATILLAVFCNQAIAQYDVVRKAEKLLLKQKYANAVVLIEKAIDKDSTNTSAYQAFALYFTADNNPAYSIDSAHLYNIEAIELHEKADEKTQQKLSKQNITAQYLLRFKKHIDSLAFLKTIDSPSVSRYNHYINVYSTSIFLDSAIELRNQLAYDNALQKNTYHSYKSFIERFPDATQVDEAKERFERLYFDESVKDGQLLSYVKFLEEHPQSHYRSLAERQILELSTLENSASSYLRFAQQFPLSIYTKLALDYAYHISKEVPTVKVEIEGYYDSLNASNEASRKELFPFYNNGFGFINELGEIVIPIDYQVKTKSSSKCHSISNDFIWLENDGQDQLITKSGTSLWKGECDSILELGTGLLQIVHGNRFGVLHKAGSVVFPPIYQNVRLLNQQYLVYQEHGLWGFASTLGRKITEPIYQSVTEANGLILIQKKEKWAITNAYEVAQWVTTPPTLSFLYDDYERFDENHIMVYLQDQVNLISNRLEKKLPSSTTDVSLVNDVFITNDKSGYHILDSSTFKKLETSSNPILSNKTGIFYQFDDQWLMWNKDSPIKLDCDSLFLQGDYFIRHYREDSVQFSPKAPVKFSNKAVFSNLQLKQEQYIIVRDDEDSSLNDSEGNIQQIESYDKISLAGDSIFIVEKDGQKGLINYQGETILDLLYDAIQRNDSITFTLLEGSKFGIFNSSDNTLISPAYDQRLKPYGSSLYIAQQEKVYGLIDHEGNAILPFEFDQILYWNATSAMVKKGYQWMIYNIQSNQPIMDQISQFSMLDEFNDVKVLKMFRENGFGVLHNKKGLLLPASFYNIYQIKYQNTALYVAEKYIEEADFYVVVYYNGEGHVVFKHAMESKDYQTVNIKNP